MWVYCKTPQDRLMPTSPSPAALPGHLPGARVWRAGPRRGPVRQAGVPVQVTGDVG